MEVSPNSPNNKHSAIIKALILLSALFILAMFSRCESPKHIAKMQRKYCPVTSDSIHTIVTRHDSLIYINSEPFSFGMETPCDTFIKIDTTVKKNGIKERIQANYKRMIFTCNDDSLKQIIKGLNQTIEKKEIVVHTEKCNLKHHTGWDSFCNYFTIIVLVLALIYIVIKIIK